MQRLSSTGQAAARARCSCVRVSAIATVNRLKPFSSVARSVQGLSWVEMHRASLLAKLAGYCYHPTEELAGLAKAEGLQLVASGRTHYTSWYVADGLLDQQQFYNKACKQWAPAALISSHAAAQPGSHPNGSSGSSSAAAMGWPRPPRVQRCRFVFVRGVQWGAYDGDMSAVTQALASFWPGPFTPNPNPPSASSGGGGISGWLAPGRPPQVSLSPAASAPSTPSVSSVDGEREGVLPPGPPLVSHTGVTRLAMDLYAALQPYLMDPALARGRAAEQPAETAAAGPAAGLPQATGADAAAQGDGGQGQAGKEEEAPEMVCLAGHSMGGALAMLTMAKCLLSGHRHPKQVSCHTYGSFPVLAHRDGGGGHRVLQELGLSDSAVRSFVLEHDPVPRVLITADPAFQVMKKYKPIRQLLDWRGWWMNTATMGSRMLALMGVAPPEAHKPLASPLISAHRFVFENVGSVYLIRGGAELVPVGAAEDVEELMQLAVNEFASQPARAIQAWLDHHHTSYTHDLQTAALAELKRELRKARNRQTEQQHRQHAQHEVQHRG